MGLQSDFMRCLEYAEALEAQQDQLSQAQNNIIFMRNESERLKRKLRICTILSALSSCIVIFIFVIIGFHSRNLINFIPFLGVFMIVFIVSFFNRIKTKKESDDFESKKNFLIQKYTSEAKDCEQNIIHLIQEIHYENLFDIVPADYFSVAAIEFCLTQIRKKLANTAEEAFRQLENEIKHLEQMEYWEQINNDRMEQLNKIERAIHINTLISLAEQNKNNN